MESASRVATTAWLPTVAPMHFGQQLGRIRQRRGLSASALARISGLHVGSIHRYEKSAKSLLTPSSALMILQALSRLSAPDQLTTADAYFIADAAGLDRNLVSGYIHGSEAAITADAQSLQGDLAELISLAGVGPASRIIRSILQALRAARPEALHPEAHPKRSLIVKRPPVQKQGYIEQIETEYEIDGKDDDGKNLKKKAANGV